MRNQIRHKLGIGLTLGLAATALSGTSVLAFQAPADTTTTSGPASVLPPGTWDQPYREYAIVTSPDSGFNASLPAADSPLEHALERTEAAG
jgi:hypothetical protein